MVQAVIRVEAEKEQLPKAPWKDEAVIQSLDEFSFQMSEYPHGIVTKEILLGTLRDGRLKIFMPIKVKFTYENEQAIAEAEDINEFGFGKNQSEALADLQRAISELYFTLEKEQDKLGVDLQKVWDVLQKKILKR
jgi:hypothetical protein